jgi:protein-S-isoprenylcysteine O-methyltransferase Ste14
MVNKIMVGEMELIPSLEMGWLNGWILLCLLYLIYGVFLTTFPKEVRARLFYYDRSRWSKKQRIFYVMGRVSVLAYLVLTIFTPLKIGADIFILGIVLFVLGLVGFIIALSNFKNMPPNQPATKGLYKISRHPQIFMLFISSFGICIAIASWLALLILIISKLFGHFRTLAEEETCLEQYGDSYRNYMKRIPRYLLIKTRVKGEG